ncbi:MAG: hypothetical protein ACO3QY_01170 [Burkholderiaceae bacterium]
MAIGCFGAGFATGFGDALLADLLAVAETFLGVGSLAEGFATCLVFADDTAAVLTAGLALAEALALVFAGSLTAMAGLPFPVVALLVDGFREVTEDFEAADFVAAALEFVDLEPILGAEDLPDLPDIAPNAPCAEVTFKFKLFSLLNQALL